MEVEVAWRRVDAVDGVAAWRKAAWPGLVVREHQDDGKGSRRRSSALFKADRGAARDQHVPYRWCLGWGARAKCEKQPHAKYPDASHRRAARPCFGSLTQRRCDATMVRCADPAWRPDPEDNGYVAFARSMRDFGRGNIHV